jgi:hypothetical protein
LLTVLPNPADEEDMTFADAVRATLAAGDVMAAAVFRPRPDATGVSVDGPVAIVVTPERVHAYRARARLTTWKLGGALGSWDRSSLRCSGEIGPRSTRLTIQDAQRGLWLDLSAVTGSSGGAAEVAHLLVGPTIRTAPHRSLDRPVGADPTGRSRRLESPESERLHRLAGRFVLAGGVIRLLAYLMAWVVITPVADPPIWQPTIVSGHVSGTELFDIQPLSLLAALAAIVLGFLYLRPLRRYLPVPIGITAALGLVVFAVQLSALGRSFPAARAEAAARGMDVRVGYALGVWVELGGVLLIVAGSVFAARAYGAMHFQEPRRPDLPGDPAADLEAHLTPSGPQSTSRGRA